MRKTYVSRQMQLKCSKMYKGLLVLPKMADLQRRWQRKRHTKSEFPLLWLLRYYSISYYFSVKCWPVFLKLNSKGFI